jgi:hypothetical protein
VAVDLEILDSFSVETQGRTITGKQGDYDDNTDEPFVVSVTGTSHDIVGSIATATVKTVWDDDDDLPATWDFFYFWCDQDVYLQFVGTATNFTIKVEAKVPFKMSFQKLLAAASTTDIVGGTEPTTETIDHINIGNYSGNTANYQATVID